MLGVSDPMTTLRHIHRYMNERRAIVLLDGRIGKISRVDTFFPKNETIVTVWLKDTGDAGAASAVGGAPPATVSASSSASGLVRVGLSDVVGPVEFERG
jgi:hypothetical protein